MSAAEALAAVAGLCDEPEYGTSTHRFWIAMLMIGAIKPERVVERVVAEVEADRRAFGTMYTDKEAVSVHAALVSLQGAASE